MERGALEFMESAGFAETDYRFAVASVLILDTGETRMEWIEDA